MAIEHNKNTIILIIWDYDQNAIRGGLNILHVFDIILRALLIENYMGVIAKVIISGCASLCSDILDIFVQKTWITYEHVPRGSVP